MNRRRYFIYYPRRMLGAPRYGVGWSHGKSNGGAVSKIEASWRTVNGVWINWPTGSMFLLFRRPSW